MNVGVWMGHTRDLHTRKGGDIVHQRTLLSALKLVQGVDKVYFCGQEVDYGAQGYGLGGAGGCLDHISEIDVAFVRGYDIFVEVYGAGVPVVYFGSPFINDAFVRASAVSVFTPSWKELLLTEFGVPHEKVFVVPQGIDTTLFKPMHMDKPDGYKRTIGYFGTTAGRYIKVPLTRIFEEFDDGETAFVVVTGSADRSTLPNSENMIVYSNISYEDMPKYYSMCDVMLCVVASPYSGSYKELESMACGVPTIAFNLRNRRYRFGGAYEYLVVFLPFAGMAKHGNIEYDHNAFVRKTRRLLMDSAERERVSAYLRSRAELFSIERTADSIGRVIEFVRT